MSSKITSTHFVYITPLMSFSRIVSINNSRYNYYNYNSYDTNIM